MGEWCQPDLSRVYYYPKKTSAISLTVLTDTLKDYSANIVRSEIKNNFLFLEQCELSLSI